MIKTAIVLCAGHGTRMASSKPKPLQEIANKAMINWILDRLHEDLKISSAICVVSNVLFLDASFKGSFKKVLQDVPKGTGDALKIGLQAIDGNVDYVYLFCADTPLITENELLLLDTDDSDVKVLGFEVDNLDSNYGRLLIDKNNMVSKIVETKHNQEFKKYKVANSGIYRFKFDVLKNIINDLNINLESNEFYATDLIEIAYNKGYKTSYELCDEKNLSGVNDLSELSAIERIMQHRLIDRLMKSGVKFIDPDSCSISFDTKIEKDVVIEPNVIIKKNVQIKSGAVIKSFSYLEDCVIGKNCQIGPFANIRNNCLLGEKVIIGNFVEVKNAKIDNFSKAKHLSYLGDCEIAESVNIGAGTITCNYNGFEKFKTIIKKSAMIGANSTLVAPLEIGENAYIAAGSVITDNVTKDSLAISRTVQKERMSWSIKFRQKYQKLKN